MRHTIITLLVLVMFAASLSHGQGQTRRDQQPPCWLAQGGPPDGSRRRPGRGPERSRSMDHRHLEQLRLLKMLEVLDLNEEQEKVFVTMFHRTRKEMQDLQDRNREVVMQLADGLAADTLDDATIEHLVDRVHELKQQQLRRFNELIEQSRDILTPQQRGKLVVFHERFEAEMLKKLRAFRERRFDRGMRDNDNSTSQGTYDPH